MVLWFVVVGRPVLLDGSQNGPHFASFWREGDLHSPLPDREPECFQNLRDVDVSSIEVGIERKFERDI
jgi:hypothetical protein